MPRIRGLARVGEVRGCRRATHTARLRVGCATVPECPELRKGRRSDVQPASVGMIRRARARGGSPGGPLRSSHSSRKAWQSIVEEGKRRRWAWRRAKVASASCSRSSASRIWKRLGGRRGRGWGREMAGGPGRRGAGGGGRVRALGRTRAGRDSGATCARYLQCSSQPCPRSRPIGAPPAGRERRRRGMA